MERMTHQLLTFGQACDLVRKSERTVRYWISRGILRARWCDSTGRHWYREIDVLRAEHSVRRSTGAR